VITLQDRPASKVLKVDGRLSAQDTELLVDACSAVSGPLLLDLTNLKFADRRGVDALRELKARGAAIIGVSPYLGLVLGGCDTPDPA
jgi:hypothetical protein